MMMLSGVPSTAQMQQHRRALLIAATSNFQHKHRELRWLAVQAVQDLAEQVRAGAPSILMLTCHMQCDGCMAACLSPGAGGEQ